MDESIENICYRYNIKNYTINNGVVDVEGNVSFYNKKIDKIPLKFGKVTGYFSCAFNKLTDLDGCPDHIGGDFYCHGNNLESIEYPSYVGGDVIIDKQTLDKLKYKYEIDMSYGIPLIKNYNNVMKWLNRKKNIESILRNNI
jgi:hypothetical protein